MEATLEIVGNLSDVGHVDIGSVLIVVLAELEVHLLREEVFQEEVHDLRVLLLLEIVVREHSHTAAHHQLAPALRVLVNSADGTVAGIGQWTGSEDGVGRGDNVQTGPVYEDEVHSCTFGLLLVFLLIILPTAQHEGVIDLTLGFLGVAVDDPGDLLIEDAVVDVCLLWVEVLIEGGANNTIRVDGNTELFGDLADVGVVPR
jgi:hypothetical protein